MAPIKVLVTGGTGFLGSRIVEALIEAKSFEITALDINPPALGTQSYPEVKYVRANVLQQEELRKAFSEARPTIVIHTVAVIPLGDARYSTKGKEAVFEVNVGGTRNVLNVSKECGAKGLVYTSSVTVVLDELEVDFKNVDETWPTGRATTTYGQSKAAAEALVLSFNTSDFLTCALRSAVLFGPQDPTCIPILHGCIARGETPFILGEGTNLQDYAYVCNVADAHVLAVRNLLDSGTAAGEAFFITNGEPVTARDICIAVWKEFGHVPSFQVRIPEGLAWWLALGMERLTWMTGSKSTLSRGMILDVTKNRYVSIAKARRVLGYEPKVSLPEAMRVSCEHFKQRWSEQEKR
ncbi:C-3 sterol dehydrogenase/C-4 decarboxylase-like protein [Trematosphaeria pertusa]|uniref:C-3 sterol dehydrogenase/C-4 decarboxylase-like protein n=1 Tax=Trematosphaeria pertusa TaxID=390896 RepID=A0A6A6HXE3_9PLEO|nr:C-3 sterol dehydrogenase/C-4 decarboxylase-like protein [Trematosphaeria pertusa]KAF2242746.1 C-3 sterol dehydrogenase/C-4 decarboxylase-like protein [Trematosphaeria pertusa]